MIIDLHNHTIPLSRDSSLNPADLIEQITRLGIDGVCLTEHNAAWDSQEFEKMAAASGIIVIPGMEITTELGHILAFGIDRYFPEMARMAQLSKISKSEGGVLVLAHPYRSSVYSKYWVNSDKSYRDVAFDFDVHGVEIFNGRGSETENRFSAHVANALQLPGTGGSDAHHLAEIGRCVTNFEDAVWDLASLLRAIRGGRMEGSIYSGDKVEP
ncbi:MAG: hypothetical protein CL793_08270 [Chloroflexi bacterium]|nr:hypothetical protein [Chloroflexota bacterium]